MASEIPYELAGHIWHTTSRERYSKILTEGQIKVEPDFADQERWGTSAGKAKYPFARSIGAVSLFDFRAFDPIIYSEQYPNSSWRAFVPCNYRWTEAIWIRFSEEALISNFISGQELLARWTSSGELYRKIMPMIEAAFIGNLSLALASSVLSYRTSVGCFENINLPCSSRE